jgi:hypothetical protein
MTDPSGSGNLRTITEKWEKGKNVIRDDVHKSDPVPIKREKNKIVGSISNFPHKT